MEWWQILIAIVLIVWAILGLRSLLIALCYGIIIAMIVIGVSML